MADVDPEHRAEHRAAGRRLGESLVGDHSLEDLRAQRRLGETIRDAERRLLARRAEQVCTPSSPRCIGAERGGACSCGEDPWTT